MEENLYDEFGNYIGPEFSDDENDGPAVTADDDDNDSGAAAADDDDDDDDSASDAEDSDDADTAADSIMMDDDTSVPSTDIVLHEDKKYYPTAEEIYGPTVETLVQDEDTQALHEPIVAPTQRRSDRFQIVARDTPTTTYAKEYLGLMAQCPDRVRNVAIAGTLHHGKTTLVDALVRATHPGIDSTRQSDKFYDRQLHYTDSRLDEQERGMSVKSSPMQLLMNTSITEKSYVMNIFDTPGHINFFDEVSAGLRMSDGLVLVVDVVEGVTQQTQLLIRQALTEQCSILLVLNKVDRLILELRMPPNDAYHKLRFLIDRVNELVNTFFDSQSTDSMEFRENTTNHSSTSSASSTSGRQNNSSNRFRFSPESGNVIFASGEMGWCFSLQSFSYLYLENLSRRRTNNSNNNNNNTKKQQSSTSEVVVNNNNDEDTSSSSSSSSSSSINSRNLHDLSSEASRSFARRFATFLWGNQYHDRRTRTFSRKPVEGPDQPRSFVQFILEPLYKIVSFTVGGEMDRLAGVLSEFNVFLRPADLKLDVRPLLKLVLSSVFRGTTAFVDAVVDHIPSPVTNATRKARSLYTGTMSMAMSMNPTLNGAGDGGESELDRGLKTCDPNGPLFVHVAKLYHKQDCSRFDVYGRILSGTIRTGQRVRVLGEGYSPDDEEDMTVKDVTRLWLYESRYRIEVPRMTAGNWVLIEGVDESIVKTATIVSATYGDQSQPIHACKPLQIPTVSCVKLAIEPLNPSELPKMLDGLRKANKSFPGLVTRVEENGEHLIFGPGELYLDSVLHDMRNLYSEIEIKVSDPSVAFRETVVETSSLKCFCHTPNQMNKLTMIAEPMEAGLAEDIESGRVFMGNSAVTSNEARNLTPEQVNKMRSSFLQQKYNWDVLAARSVWAFGPDGQGTNILIDDSLAEETDKRRLSTVKDFIVQGFQWGCREGPLCEEPIRNVKFRLLEAQCADNPIHRAGGQIIPTARRVAYSAFLLATPRIMEPVYFVEIVAPADTMSTIMDVLSRRRGHVVQDTPKPGTNLYEVRGYLPVIESFGFETDLRCSTQGQAYASCRFDHWSLVPGDPLDRSVILQPLTPSPPNALAREFMVKTRRRKGLSDDVTISKFFDEPMLLELAKLETL